MIEKIKINKTIINKIIEEHWIESTINRFKDSNLLSKLCYEMYFKDIDNIKNLKILDYGSGAGQCIKLLRNVTCYDNNKEVIKYGKKKGIEILGDLDLIKDEDFDIVFCSFCLEHCLEPRTELKNMYKKLKKGGKLILVIGINRKKNGFCNYGYYYQWTFNALNSLLINIGFEVKENKLVGYKGGQLFKIFSNNFKLYYKLINFLGKFFKKNIMLVIAKK